MGIDRVLLQAWNAVAGREENVRVVHNSLKMIDHLQYAAHTGNAWSKAEKHSIASGVSLDHLIIPNSGQHVVLDGRPFNATKGPNDVFVYEAPFSDTNSYGTDVSSIFANHNRETNNLAPFTCREDPYINASSIGTLLDYALMEQIEGGAVKVSGGKAQSGLLEWHLDSNKEYLVRFTNNHTADIAIVQCRISVYVP